MLSLIIAVGHIHVLIGDGYKKGMLSKDKKSINFLFLLFLHFMFHLMLRFAP